MFLLETRSECDFFIIFNKFTNGRWGEVLHSNNERHATAILSVSVPEIVVVIVQANQEMKVENEEVAMMMMTTKQRNVERE